MKRMHCFTLLSCLLTVTLYAGGVSNKHKDKIWDKLAPYFSCPDPFKNSYGTYRSTLLFYNGEPVKKKTDWLARRKEIKSQWSKMLGEWPPLLENNTFEILEKTQKKGFTQYKVHFLWTPNEKTTGYLLVPHKKGKMPAVITVYYDPETAIGQGKNPDRDFALQLAERGFVTLSLGTTEATKSETYSLFYPDINHSTVQPLSMLAYAAANAWKVLSRRPEVDSTRIGITGHSFGGKWAMFASCLYDKFACAAWSDPGIVFDESRESVNYWEPYYLGYHPQPWRKRGMITKENPAKGLYPQLVKEGYDLHELHALMAPRPFLVSGGSEDPLERWIPLNRTLDVYKLLGYKNRVGMNNRLTHAPTKDSNEIIYLFFEYFLK